MHTLIVAWLDVRSSPLRTLAAIGGMVAAVMAVVVVDAAGVLSRQANDDYITAAWGRAATLQIIATDGNGSAPLNEAERAEANRRLALALHDNGLDRFSTDVSIGMVLITSDGGIPTYPTWVSSTFPDVSRITLLAGMIPRITASSRVPHAVISLDLARRLGYSGADIVGQTIHWARADGFVPDLRTAPTETLIVDAVAAQIGPTYDQHEMVVVTDLPIPERLAAGTSNSLLHVNPQDVSLATTLIQGIRADSGTEPVFDVIRLDRSDELAPLLAQQSVTARSISVVALIIGGLGILGVGLAGVRERARDFGLRRALGSDKTGVFASVIAQTLIEVLIAALIAVPLAAGTVAAFARQLVLRELPLPQSTVLPVESALNGLLAALLVGLVAGLLPAIRAARLSVVQALRD